MSSAEGWVADALAVVSAAGQVIVYAEEVAEAVEHEGSRGSLARLLLGDDRITWSEWREHKATITAGLEAAHEGLAGILEEFSATLEEYLAAFGLLEDEFESLDVEDDDYILCAECGGRICDCEDNDDE